MPRFSLISYMMCFLSFFPQLYRGMIDKSCIGTSLAVQRLRLHTSNAGGVGLIPGQGTKIPHAARPEKFFLKLFIYLRCTASWFDIRIHCEMMTTIKLINTSFTSHCYQFWVCLCFFFGGVNTQDLLLANFRYIIQYY